MRITEKHNKELDVVVEERLQQRLCEKREKVSAVMSNFLSNLDQVGKRSSNTSTSRSDKINYSKLAHNNLKKETEHRQKKTPTHNSSATRKHMTTTKTTKPTTSNPNQ